MQRESHQFFAVGNAEFSRSFFEEMNFTCRQIGLDKAHERKTDDTTGFARVEMSAACIEGPQGNAIAGSRRID